jgi:hypothetical protein
VIVGITSELVEVAEPPSSRPLSYFQLFFSSTRADASHRKPERHNRFERSDRCRYEWRARKGVMPSLLDFFDHETGPWLAGAVALVRCLPSNGYKNAVWVVPRLRHHPDVR